GAVQGDALGLDAVPDRQRLSLPSSLSRVRRLPPTFPRPASGYDAMGVFASAVRSIDMGSGRFLAFPFRGEGTHPPGEKAGSMSEDTALVSAPLVSRPAKDRPYLDFFEHHLSLLS
ncbi:MAG: hypothetical protein ACUVS1_10630, partial [Actinomycetota bacterium]